MNRFRAAAPSALAGIAVLVVCSFAPPIGATTYNVSTSSGLISALASANATLGPDIINLAPGYYVLGPGYTPLDVTDDVTVNGGGRPGTVLDGTGVGGSAFSVHTSFTANPTNNNIHATFTDLTLENFHPGLDFNSGPTSLLIVDRCTIMGSQTDGLYTDGGPIRILNTTIRGNHRGVLIESADSLYFDNCTIVENATRGIEKYGSILTVRNSIIAYNGTDCSGQPGVSDHNINGDGTCGSGFFTGNAMLGNLADNGGPTLTYATLPGSHAIDAGFAGEAVDQRGVTRPQGTSGDIGSFERTAVPFVIVSSTVGAGGTVTTDTTGSGATPANPVQTSVTAPAGGTLTIEQGPGAAGFGFIGQQVHITAVPDATAANPFTIVFVIDASVIPAGQSAATIVVKKNGVVVPPCTGAPGVAGPDPCVSSRQALSGGDARITVLSSSASTWDFAAGGTAGVTTAPVRLELAVVPNPVRNGATLRFALPVSALVNLSLFDVSGRKVATLVSAFRPAGRYAIAWHDAKSVPPGLYFARLRAGAESRVTTVIRAN